MATDPPRYSTPFAALLAASIAHTQAKGARVVHGLDTCDFEILIMRDLSRGSAPGYFAEIWSKSDDAVPAYKSGYFETIEGARDDADCWLRGHLERQTKARA